MRKALLLAVLVALPLSASAAPPVSTAVCKAHLAASLTTMSADRFAEELAGAEGMAGAVTPATTRSAAVMLIDLNGAIGARDKELATLKAQVVTVQDIIGRLAALRAKEPTSSHYLDTGAETALGTLRDSLVARVTRVSTQLDAERNALDQSLQFHCTASALPASASAH